MVTKVRTTTSTTKTQEPIQLIIKTNAHSVKNQDIKLTNVSKKIDQVKDQTLTNKNKLVKESTTPSVKMKGTLN
jgi:hypothetical protein